MSDKPTELPAWATNDTSAEVTEPGGALKATGAVPDTQTGAQHINWILHRIYLWIVWFNIGIFQRSSLTDNTPIFQASDRNGRPRSYLGPEGYTMGPAIQETYRWGPVDIGTVLSSADTEISFSGGMAVSGVANAAVEIMPGSSGAATTADPLLRVFLLDAASSEGVVIYPLSGVAGDGLISDLDNVVSVMTWTASFSAISLANMDFYGGFNELANKASGSILSAAVNAFVVFRVSEAASGNFECHVSDGATGNTLTDSGVLMAINTLYSFRIEYHGKNTPVGVGNSTEAVVRFFIDGVEVHEDTGVNVPQTSDCTNWSPVHGATADSTGPGADKSMYVGTTKLAWNASLDFVVPI